MIDKGIVLNLSKSIGWHRAGELLMFNAEWNLRVDPGYVDKLVIGKGDIAVVLSIDEGSVPTDVESCEYVVVPDLVVCGPWLLVEWADWHWFVYGDSVLSANIDVVAGNVHINSLLSHDQLLSKEEGTLRDSDPLERRVTSIMQFTFL